MRIFDDTDDVFSTLRMPATDAELRHESQVVDLMASAHPSAKGTSMLSSTRFTSVRARVGTLIAAGVIGFGGVAAAGPGGFDPLGLGVGDGQVDVGDTIPDDTVADDTIPDGVVPEDTIPEETIPEETVPETTLAEEPSDEEGASIVAQSVEVEAGEAPKFVDNPDTAFNEEMCLPGNHGKTVSAVARGESPFEDVEVRDAAQSDCGKKGLEEADDDADESEESDAETVQPDDDDGGDDSRSERSEKPGKGNQGNKDKQGKDSPGNSGNTGNNGKKGK